ncbi:hypothetical protein [Phenylobacterium sp.]|uniref:hypothetical protein n=1 Tax=Phenylobacterium sp. TaxID=1871053 RepID=UPI0025E0FA2A|nr:hypothetical protein [Phenylobacterium sp.]MBX3484325.1 hypothetical protein [Phenylobacterium sp.]MCW5759156.1 hypothetical protein [Phenylobacterium sp.]
MMGRRARLLSWLASSAPGVTATAAPTPAQTGSSILGASGSGAYDLTPGRVVSTSLAVDF